jgi:hypothetical protein
MPMPRCAVALRSRFQNDMAVACHGRGMGAAWARHGRGMGAAWQVCINTAAMCKSNGKDKI